MHLLTRYLLAQFVKYFITLNVGFAALYLLIDFFEKFDEFAEAEKSLTMILNFFMLNIPFVVDQLSPVLILLAGVITLGILNNNNELLALKASGIPLRKIIRPILAGALVATALFILAAQFLLPKTISTTNDIWYKQVRGKVPLGIFRNGRYYYKGSEGFYSFQWPNKDRMVFQNFSYSTWTENFDIKSMVNAEFCGWKDAHWECSNGQLLVKDSASPFVAKPFGVYSFDFPEAPEDFLVPEYEAAEMSLTRLFSDISKRDIESEKTRARAEFYGRISYLLIGIPLLLMGLPILLLSYQKWGRDLSIAIPVSCFMAFVAWGIWGALQSFAKSGYLMTLPAAFVVHILFSLIGIYLLSRQDV